MNKAGVADGTGKKATIRDVANLAGVSVATVSYIINGREDQRISEATKKKVWQAINFLNYTPNPYAVGLNTDQLHTVIVRSSKNVSPMMEAEILCFMRGLNSLCEERGYTLTYSMDKRAMKIAASACVCFDMPKADFYALAGENFIPVVAVESLIDDPIFYQITPDYEKLAACAQDFFGADFTYVCIKPCDEEAEKKILGIFKSVRFLSSVSEIAAITDENVVLSQPSLFPYFDLKKQVLRYEDYAEKRAKAVMDSIVKALDRLNILDEGHFIKL